MLCTVMFFYDASTAQKLFKTIVIKGALKVSIKQANGNVVISGNDELMTEEMGTTITIMDGVGNGNTITIKDSNIEEIAIEGAAEINELSALQFKTITLDFEGACEVPIKVTATNATFKFGGASNITLSGSASTTSIIIWGSGDVNAKDFVTDNMNFNVSGSNNSWVNAKKILKINANGACNIKYKSYLVATKPKKKYLPVVSKKVAGAVTIDTY